MMKHLQRISIVMLFATAFGGRALSQQSTLIQGVVVDANSNAPISKAAVELRSTAAATGTTLATTHTDRDGRFFIPNVAAGQYRITVTHAGHIAAEYGQRQAGGAGGTLTVVAGQRSPDIRIAMTAGGVISGRITDKGQPIGLADALVLKATYTEGQLALTPVLSVRTDDLGEYHLFWLPPGRYYVVGVVWDNASSIPRYVTSDGDNENSFSTGRYIGRAVFLRATAGGVAENEAHIPIFYPGTPDPQRARAIEIEPGAVLRGIDIDASAMPIRHVRVRVVGMGPLSQDTTVRMVPLISCVLTSASQAPRVSLDSNGVFDVPNVVPGRYALFASSGILIGRAMVEVRDRDVNDVVVSLNPSLTVSGRVVIEGAGPTPPVSSLRVGLRLDPLLPGAPTFAGPVQSDGSFTLPAGTPLMPGDYRVIVNPLFVSPTPPDSVPPPLPAAMQNLYVKSIRMGDVDVLNDRLHLDRQPTEPLTIVVGTNPGRLSGRVLDERQQPAPSTTLVLIHENGLRYRVNEKTTTSDASGRFEFQNVPPGDYRLFAWESVDRGAWQDPEFMRSIENRGVPVRIEEGKQSTADASLIAG